MNKEELKSNVVRIKSDLRKKNQEILPIYYETLQLFRDFLKEGNAFKDAIVEPDNGNISDVRNGLLTALKAFERYLDNDLFGALSPEREIKVSVFKDYLFQANDMINENKYHPAAAVVLAGASLEEFLRDWCMAENISISGTGNLEKYKSGLLRNGLITKQDGKDITSWAGLRNSAAHGVWADVNNRVKISLMVDGINLFIRKYSK